jgi:tetratricopeptide (TPR) repeat protein
MNVPGNLVEQMREKSDEQLQIVLASPGDWLPEALDAAQAELHRRGVQTGKVATGNVYLAMGDLTNAEAQYLRAYELFPDDENQKPLTAIRKRIAKERGLTSPSR